MSTASPAASPSSAVSPFAIAFADIEAAALRIRGNAVITPLLEDASACARCFRRRFVSAPPPPYSVEFCESVIANSERDPQFEYAGFLPSTARLVAELVLKSLEVPQAGATVIDQFGAQHQGAPLLAVHGCRCRRVSGRSHAGPERFTRHLLGDLPWPSH